MKDYNYYKTIADICNERNDIYKKFMVEEIVPLNKTTLFREPEEGNSFLLKSGEEKYLMVETSTSFYWVSSRCMLYDINNVEGNFAKYLHDYDQEDHNGERHKLFVFSYIDGESLKDYLSNLDKVEAYNLGLEFSKTLKNVHLVPVNVLTHHIPHWYGAYKWTQKALINSTSNDVIEKALNYYKENEDIIYNRYSTAEYYNKINGNYVRDENGNIVIEKVLAFIFRDVRFENLVVKNSKVFIKCPVNIYISDPFYDFKYLSLIALENEYFASGIIDGYFEGEISPYFFKMLKYYTSELIINEYNKTLDYEIINKIYDSYDDFRLEIPKWYLRNKNL